MADQGNGKCVTNNPARDECCFQKDQKVFYEGRDAHIIQVKPFFVIKTGDRVVCGDLQKFLQTKHYDRHEHA